MLNKKLLPAALAITLFAGTTVTAVTQAADIAGNVALTSDYKFRGISQTDESPAIQGGFDIAWDNGIYVGAWGSSVDFDANVTGFDGSLELDLYGGWAGDITDNVGVDVGYMYYGYPGDDGDDGDYQEVYLKLNLWDGTLGAVYSDDYYGGTGSFYYLSGDYSFGLGENFSLDLHLGYNDLDENGGFLATATDSYIDYSAGVTASWLAVDWTLAYVGTDLDKKDVFGTKWGDDSVIFTISKSM
ncbi:MAG: TorF family putative porin [Halioglobus sp.]